MCVPQMLGIGGVGVWEVGGKHKCSLGARRRSHWVKLQMLVTIKPFRGLGRTFNNLCSPKTAQFTPTENTENTTSKPSTHATGFNTEISVLPHLCKLTHVCTLNGDLATFSHRTRPAAPELLSLPSLLRTADRGQPEWTPKAAQALISTCPDSSCSRILCTPAVRSVCEALRDRPGELGARGGDVCVRPVAGERAGERG